MDYVAQNVAICHSCGYNLRGHGVICVCPECGVRSDFEAMHKEALAFVKRRRVFILGPLALLKKRTKAWWWAYDETPKHSIRVAIANIALAVLLTILLSFTIGSMHVRVTIQTSSHFANGEVIPLYTNEYTVGPFGEYHVGNFEPAPDFTATSKRNADRVEDVFDIQIEYGNGWPVFETSLATLAFWILPAWGIPAVLSAIRSRRPNGDTPSGVRRSALAAVLYESPRVVYLQLAVWLTWPVQMICVWLDPSLSTNGLVTLIVTAMFACYNVLAWVQSLRSDHIKVLNLSPLGIALVSVVYGVVLPTTMFFCYGMLIEYWR